MRGYGSGLYGAGPYGVEVILPVLPFKVSHTPGLYGAVIRLYRCDRMGNRIERVPVRLPVAGTIAANEDATPRPIV